MVGLVERTRKEGRRMWREVTAAAARGCRRRRKEMAEEEGVVVVKRGREKKGVRVLEMTRVMILFAIVCLCEG